MLHLPKALALSLVIFAALGCSADLPPLAVPEIPTVSAPNVVEDLPAAATLPITPTLAPYQDLAPQPTLAPFPTLPPVGRQPPPTPQPATDADLMYQALDLALEGDPLGVEVMAATGRAEFIPVLVEFLRFPWLFYFGGEVDEAINYSLNELAGVHLDSADFDYLNAEWSDWLAYIGRSPDLRPPQGFTAWKGELFSRLVDPEMGAFLYQGAPSTIRVEEIAWGGVPKDGIPDLINPPVIPGSKAAYLHDNERVFGVSFNGDHRAYPHRILNAHEMVNDVVGGVPFALAY